LPVLLLAACAGGPPAPQQADQEAKAFGPPAPDKGALYIYRPGWLGLAKAIDVTVVGGATAQLGSNNYLRLEGPPGPVEIDCRMGDKNGAAQVQIADGQIRYVEVSVTMGWWTPGCDVAEVPPDKGQSAVLIAKRIEPQ
jgi:hypothetical protein